MENLSAKAFFSRAFDDRSILYVEHVKNICDALSVESFCVDQPSAKTTVEEARELIKKSDFLVALCTRKEKIEGTDNYTTSVAVREEIAMAGAFGIPIVCFIEEGVKVDGFLSAQLTYYKIKELGTPTPDELGKIIKGIHDTKLSALRKKPGVYIQPLLSNYFYESIHMQVELLELQKGLCWQYVIEKNIRFTADEGGPLTHTAWAPIVATNVDHSPIYQLDFELNGKLLSPKLEAKSGTGSINVKSQFEPPIRSGEKLFIRERFRSPFINPIHTGQSSKNELRVDGRSFQAYDGLCVVQRIEKLQFSCVFPDWYGERLCQPIVGTFSNELDQLHQGEINRIAQEKLLKISKFNSKIIFDLTVDRPYFQFLYGLAWNLPAEEDLKLPVAGGDVDWRDR